MPSQPEFPYTWQLAEVDGLEVTYTADDKSEWLDEDQLWDMEEAVNKAIAKAKHHAGEHGYDEGYDKLIEEIKNIDSGIEVR
jgi:hypothetical protein